MAEHEVDQRFLKLSGCLLTSVVAGYLISFYRQVARTAEGSDPMGTYFILRANLHLNLPLVRIHLQTAIFCTEPCRQETLNWDFGYSSSERNSPPSPLSYKSPSENIQYRPSGGPRFTLLNEQTTAGSQPPLFLSRTLLTLVKNELEVDGKFHLNKRQCSAQ